MISTTATAAGWLEAGRASGGKREDGGRRLGNRARVYIDPLRVTKATPDSDPLPTLARVRSLPLGLPIPSPPPASQSLKETVQQARPVVGKREKGKAT